MTPRVLDLRRLAGLGYTVAQAAAEVGTTPKSVRCAARRHGFRFAHGRPRPAERADDARALAAAGLSLAEAARAMGLHASTLGDMADRVGFRFISRRKRAEAKKVAKIAARKAAAEPEVTPASIVVDFVRAKGRLSAATAQRIPPAVLGEAMRRLAEAEGHRRRA